MIKPHDPRRSVVHRLDHNGNNENLHGSSSVEALILVSSPIAVAPLDCVRAAMCCGTQGALSSVESTADGRS